MSRFAFIYFGRWHNDALCNWVQTISEHTHHHQIRLCINQTELEEFKPHHAVLLTSSDYKAPRMQADLEMMLLRGVPTGVLHNEDWGLIPPGRVPHFCWQRTSQRRLYGYDATLVRQPLLPAFNPPRRRKDIHLATFGHCEPKKSVLHLARWAKDHGLRFTSYAPTMLASRYEDYINMVRRVATVQLYDWKDHVTELAQYFETANPPVSHFLFDVIPTKGGSGGSSTSCRYAAAFNLPIIVLDDEPTYMADNYNCYPDLRGVPTQPDELRGLRTPKHDFTPDAYVDELCLVLDGKL